MSLPLRLPRVRHNFEADDVLSRCTSYIDTLLRRSEYKLRVETDPAKRQEIETLRSAYRHIHNLLMREWTYIDRRRLGSPDQITHAAEHIEAYHNELEALTLQDYLKSPDQAELDMIPHQRESIYAATPEKVRELWERERDDPEDLMYPLALARRQALRERYAELFGD